MFSSNPTSQSFREGKFKMLPSTKVTFLGTSNKPDVIFYTLGESKWTSVPWEDCFDESCCEPKPSESAGSVVITLVHQPCEEYICLAARPWIQNRMLFVFGKPGYKEHMLIRLNGDRRSEYKPFTLKHVAPILDTAYSFKHQRWIIVTAKEVICIPAKECNTTRFEIRLSPENTICAATARLFDDLKSPPLILIFLKNNQDNQLGFAFGTISITPPLNFQLVKLSNSNLNLFVEEIEIVEIHVERDTETSAFISATMIIHVSKGHSLGIHKLTLEQTEMRESASGQSQIIYKIANHSPIFEGPCSQVQSLKDSDLVSFIRKYPDNSYGLCAINYHSQTTVCEASLGYNYQHYFSKSAAVGTVNFFVWLNSEDIRCVCLNSGIESHIPQGVKTLSPPQLDQLKKDSRSFKVTAHPFQASLSNPTDWYTLAACDNKYRISSLNSGINLIGTMDFPIEAMTMVPFYQSLNSLPNLYLLYVLERSGKLTTLALDQSGRVTIFLREQLLLLEEMITHAKFCAEDLSLALITRQNAVIGPDIKRVRLYHNARSSSSRTQWYLKSSAPIDVSDSATLARAFDNPAHVLVLSWVKTAVSIIRNPISSRVRIESQLNIAEGIQHLVTNTRHTVLAIITLNNYLCLYDIRNPTNPQEIFKNLLPPNFGEIRFCTFAENTDYLMLVPSDGILRMFPIWNNPIKCYKPKCNDKTFEVASSSTAIFVKPRFLGSEEYYVACINSAGQLTHGFSTFPANGIPFASTAATAATASAETLPKQDLPETRPTAWQLDQAVRTLGYRRVVNTAAAAEEVRPINTGLTLPASPRIEWSCGVTFPEMRSTTGAQAYENQRLTMEEALLQGIQRIHTINGYNTRDHICWDQNPIPGASMEDLSNEFKRVAAEGRIVAPQGVRGLKKLGDIAYSVKILSREGGDFRAIAEFIEEVLIAPYYYRLYRITYITRHQQLEKLYQKV